MAYGFISVARKAKVVPELKRAIQTGTVTVSQVRRITSVINETNAPDLLQKVQTLTQKEIEKDVARISPKAVTNDRAKYVTEDMMEVKFGASEEFVKKLKRAQDIVSQQTKTHAKMETAIEKALDIFLEKQDPVRRAERVLERHAPSRKTNDVPPSMVSVTEKHRVDFGYSKDSNSQNTTLSIQKLSLRRVDPEKSPQMGAALVPTLVPTLGNAPPQRPLLPAKTKHHFFHRDRGQCTHPLPNGERCAQTRWIEIHHRVPKELGGTDVLSNLTTLCSNHHKAVHEEFKHRAK